MIRIIDENEKKILFKSIPSGFQREVLQTLKRNISEQLEEISFINNCGITWNTFGSGITGYYEYIIIYFSPYCELKVEQIVDYIRKTLFQELEKATFLTAYKRNNFGGKEMCLPILIDHNIETLTEENFKEIKCSLRDYIDLEYDNLFLFKNDSYLKKIEVKNYLEKPAIGNFVFMGYGFQMVKRLNITDFLCIKIFEKILGDNESSSVYFEFRNRGDIYTAITQFFFEYQLLISQVQTPV